MTQLALRKNYFIDPVFQLRFISKFCSIVVLSFVAIGCAIFLMFKNFAIATIGNAQAIVSPISNTVFFEVAVMLALIAAGASLAVVFLTLIVSHKISGPVFRIKKEIECVQRGDLTRKFSIRNSDQLQELAQSLEMMTQALRKKHLAIGGQYRSLSNFLEEKNFGGTKEDREKLLQMVKELYEALSYFKV